MTIAGCGYYQYGAQPPRPFVATQVLLSGWTQDGDGRWLPVQNVRLNPAATRLQAQCDCPINWTLDPIKPYA